MEPQEVVNNLYTNYNEGKLAHAFLVETNNIEKCLQDIKLFCKKIICNDKYKDNCTNCNICNLIDKNEFPSLIIISKNDKKEITKESIEELKHAFIYKSSYSQNSVYIILEPEKMNNKAFNIMLKFLEEPEENIIGFFITSLKEDVAPTILSRCEQIKMLYVVDKNNKNTIENQKFYEYAKEYVEKINNKEDTFWYQNNVLIKVLNNREDVVSFFKIIYTIYDLKLKNETENYKKYLEVLNIINKYLEQLNFNININLLLNSFSIEMGDINGL